MKPNPSSYLRLSHLLGDELWDLSAIPVVHPITFPRPPRTYFVTEPRSPCKSTQQNFKKNRRASQLTSLLRGYSRLKLDKDQFARYKQGRNSLTSRY